MTFKEIQDLVLDNAQELQSMTDFSLTKVKQYINRAYYDFVRQTRCIELDIDITTVADQEYYTSADAANLAFIYDIYEVRYIDTLSAGSAAEYGDILLPTPHKDLRDKWSSGTPDQYWVKNSNSRGSFKIGTYPIIGTSNLKLRVSAYTFPLTDLASNSDEPIIREAWQDALVEHASHKIFKAYSHLKPEYRQRSRDHLAEYQIYVQDAKMVSDEQKDRNTIIQDVYNY